MIFETEHSDQASLPAEKDWVIPADTRSAVVSESNLEDFVIGEHLLVQLDDYRRPGPTSELEIDQILVHHLNVEPQAIHPLAVASAMLEEHLAGVQKTPEADLVLYEGLDLSKKNLFFQDWNARISEGVPFPLWQVDQIPLESWEDISGKDFVGDEDQALDMFFDDQRKFLQEIRILNDRVLQDCQEILNRNESDHRLDPLDPNNALSNVEKTSARNKFLFDRDLIEEKMQTVQSWINQAILVGDLEQMREFKELKDAVYETNTLIRKISLRYQIDEGGTPLALDQANPLSTEVGGHESLLETLEMRPTRYSRAVRKTKKKELTEEDILAQEAAKFKLTAKTQTSWSPKTKAVALILLFLLVPMSYFLSKWSISSQGKKMDVSVFSPIIKLKKAYEVKNNFVAQVDYDWKKLDRAERLRQVQKLHEFNRDEGYELMIIYYPDGNPAANVIKGQILLF